MHIYSLTLQLELPSRSLKGKRGIVKSVLARARQRFNVAAAEVDQQDTYDTAILAFVTVSGSRVKARQTMEQLEDWLVDERPDVMISAGEIEEC